MTISPVDYLPNDALIQAALNGKLTETQAAELATKSPEILAFSLLAASKRIAELEAKANATNNISPATPSGMIPIYTKPNTQQQKSTNRRQKPGARKGHTGHRRATPTKIDVYKEHRLKSCPHCGGEVQKCNRTRTRIIEDIPQVIEPVVTEHTIHRDYCPKCKKHVEPIVADALPGATLGHRVVTLTSWLHYGLGVTIDQIIEILQYQLQTRLTPGGLIDAWHRVAKMLTPWYEQIADDAKASAHLHADETGWRVQGKTHWLWCFTNGENCYYLIDRKRGSPVLQKFFGDAFDGILLHDFYTAYESIDVLDRQYCLVHLLRELEKVDVYNKSTEWQVFAKILRRLIRDGIRLRKREDFSPGKYRSRIVRIGKRMDALIDDTPSDESIDADVRRLCKRLRRTGDHIFTFLDYPGIPFENNFAERQIRPAVVLRKNSQSNRSDRGAKTQAIMMSIYRTLKLRSHPPLDTIVESLKIRLQAGQLPPLPAKIVANG